MSTDTQALRAYFFKLGLSSELADVYLALHAYGPQSISELARNSDIERTRIYRLSDEMRSSGLVEIEVRYKRSIFRAAPVSNLQLLLTRKEEELRELKAGFREMQAQLTKHFLESGGTKIQSYHGEDGLKQMLWNQTRSKSENLSILYENMQGRTNLTFFERWVRVFNERDLTSRSIIGDNFVRTQQRWYSNHTNERIARWEGRYLPDIVFPITHSTVIYDDVTVYYNWKDGEIFGMEIYNQEIADGQRHFFEMLWMQGVAIDDLTFNADKEG